MEVQPTVSAGPVRLDERATAPDLARGLALLGIAVANSVVHLYGRELGPSARPVDATFADRAVDGLAALLVDNRGYPLFSFLLGYGTAQLVARHVAAGIPETRTTAVLARRGLALLALGFLHALLLFSGDILGLYGLLALALAALVRARDRVLLLTAAVCLLPLAALSAVDGVAFGDTTGSHGEPDPLAAAGLRLLEWANLLLTSPFFGVGLLAPMLLGVLAARRRVLDEPAAHRPLLRAVAAAGLPVGVLGGLPLALTSTGVWDPPTPVDAVVGAVHGLSGLAMALGYAAVAGLVAASGTGPVRRALVACGRRSLSCYLAQSVLLVPLMAPWALGLGGRLGTAAAAALAAGVWLLTVLGAAALERAGRRGPAEVLLRRVVYGGQPTERQGRERSSAT